MTTTPNPLTESHVRTLSGQPIPGTDSPRADELAEGDEILTSAGRRAYVEQVDDDNRPSPSVVLHLRYLDDSPGRWDVGRSVRFPRYLPMSEQGTPALVRELIAIKQESVRGTLSGTQHKRLYEIVDELRTRGVLD